MIFFLLGSSSNSLFPFFLDLRELLLQLRMIAGEILVSDEGGGSDCFLGILEFRSFVSYDGLLD